MMQSFEIFGGFFFFSLGIAKVFCSESYYILLIYLKLLFTVSEGQ